MKTEDFKKLKEICEREGFNFSVESNAYNTFHITKNPFMFGKIENNNFAYSEKDPWEGVEFVKTKFKGWGFYKKVSIIESNRVYFSGGTWLYKNELVPITESEYVEQLKKEAFGLFGDIKEGDSFKRPRTKTIGKICSKPELEYQKEFDCLCCGGIVIYNKGVWAMKVPERDKDKVTYNNCIVRVDATGGDYYHEVEFSFFLSNPKVGFDSSKLGKFLAKKFENYLNDQK